MELLKGMRRPTKKEADDYMLAVLHEINKPARTKEETIEAWEKGWGENLKSGDPKPGYFRDSKFLRYGGEIVVCEDPQTEHKLFEKMRDAAFKKYLRGIRVVVELGCGSCQNLVALRDMKPHEDLWLAGFDRSEKAVEIAKSEGFHGECFDMTKPDGYIDAGAAIVTVHALEQLGTEHGKILDWLLKSKPEVVVHVEPIYEFYRPLDLLDVMAMMYHDKRGYLKGYYPALIELDKRGEIEILEARRPYIGGVFHEASVVVWRPK